MGRHDDCETTEERCCFTDRRLDNPFNTKIEFCCDGLIHQQFRVRVNAEASADPTVVYSAAPFDVLAVNVPTAKNANFLGDPIFPFGTVIATNLSAAAFTFVVAGEVEEETEVVVPPGSQAAITAPRISSVFVLHPTDPIRGVFDFDIFHPGDPVYPTDPI